VKAGLETQKEESFGNQDTASTGLLLPRELPVVFGDEPC